MADELIKLDTTIIGIDSLINKASTVEEAKVLFTVKDVIYSQQRHSTDAKPVRHGRWVCEFYNDVFDVYQADCSVCKKESTDKYDKVSESYEYCPHCGAKMDLEDGDTNG